MEIHFVIDKCLDAAALMMMIMTKVAAVVLTKSFNEPYSDKQFIRHQ